MKVKIPMSLCDMVFPESMVGLRPFYSLKPDVLDWVKTESGNYHLTDESRFEGNDIFIDIFIKIPDPTIAVQFKLRWL